MKAELALEARMSAGRASHAVLSREGEGVLPLLRHCARINLRATVLALFAVWPRSPMAATAERAGGRARSWAGGGGARAEF